MKSSNTQIAEMKHQLAAAKEQSGRYLQGDALPARDAVRALVASNALARWEALSDEERFFLYEISPEARARATPAEQAGALCTGLRSVSAEWWGTPGTPANDMAERLVALGPAAAACLRPLLDAGETLRYHDGESNAMAQDHGWISGDLAAGLAAAIVGQSYDPTQSADKRAARRAELARALDAMKR